MSLGPQWEFGRPLTPEELAAVEAARVTVNHRRARSLLAPLLASAVALTVLLVRFAEATTPAHRAWRSNLVALSGAFIAYATVTLVADRLRHRLAGVAAAMFPAFLQLWGALSSANVQRIRPAVDLYLLFNLCAVFLFRERLLRLGATQLLGGAILAAGIVTFQHDPLAARTQLMVVGTVVGAVLVVGRSNLVLLAREVVADRLIDAQRAQLEAQQRELAALNQSLEQRVDAQVALVVQRSKEVDQLNAALRAQVDQSARDLSALLQRVARGDDRVSLAPGSLLNERFVLGPRLGGGGMGEVFRAIDQSTGEAVVVKVIAARSASDLDAMRRFLREARASVRVDHSAVVSARHVDVAEGRLFAVFPLIEGSSLDRLLRDGESFTVGRVARIGRSVADALAAAHAAGVVHRDIKPGNVMVLPDDRGVRLLDFGISSLYEVGRQETRDTHEGMILGTPAYMAPEQVTDPTTAGDRADVYSLGVMLFELLAGRRPFVGDNPRALLLAQVSREPPRLRDVTCDAVPDALCALLDRCLAKEPTRRPTARSLRDALDEALAALPGDGAPVPRRAARDDAATQAETHEGARG